MKKSEVQFGAKYRLVPLYKAEKIDNDYRKYNYGSPCGTIETRSGVWGTDALVEILESGSEYGKFEALFPNGMQWVVYAEWLLPASIEIKSQKSLIRFIRG